jgi:murein L,D-transpeptidase YafK
MSTCVLCRRTWDITSVSTGLPLPPTATADRVIVIKCDRTLTLMYGPSVLKTYKISLGTSPVGPKQQQGDHKTPEGDYIIDRRNPKSRFYRSLHISYPDANDRQSAAQAGTDPGGDIMIHGLPNGFGWLGDIHLVLDWTDGCIAVTDEEMDEIWRVVADGTPIEIRP